MDSRLQLINIHLVLINTTDDESQSPHQPPLSFYVPLARFRIVRGLFQPSGYRLSSAATHGTLHVRTSLAKSLTSQGILRRPPCRLSACWLPDVSRRGSADWSRAISSGTAAARQFRPGSSEVLTMPVLPLVM